MAIKTGIMRFARNKKRGKNGQKLFCLSTKTCLERAKTIMAIRYKKWLLDTKDGENGIIWVTFLSFLRVENDVKELFNWNGFEIL